MKLYNGLSCLILVLVYGLIGPAVAREEEKTMERATFAAGCFWGVESIFQQVDGVIDTKVGYTGGSKDNPTYKQVCYTDTGHAEAIQVTFDPMKVSYTELLDIFWRAHDPTTLNRQGPDIGTQYRSVVFYLNEEQRQAAEKQKKLSQERWERPIVTEIVPAEIFWDAEDYHQKYFEKRGIKKSCHFLRE